MDAVLSLVPEEERVSYSAMTGQSLFYMGEDGLEAQGPGRRRRGRRGARELRAEASAERGRADHRVDGEGSGHGQARDADVPRRGPVGLFLTTTAITVDEELLNRCIVLTVDEGSEQTRAIHERQREAQTLEGMLAKVERKRIAHAAPERAAPASAARRRESLRARAVVRRRAGRGRAAIT